MAKILPHHSEDSESRRATESLQGTHSSLVCRKPINKLNQIFRILLFHKYPALFLKIKKHPLL